MRATAEDHDLITVPELAEHYGITDGSARKLMSDNGITVVSGYPRAAALTVPRPGRGVGGGRPRKNRLNAASGDGDRPAQEP